jgi:arginyl-tRNA synthetase
MQRIERMTESILKATSGSSGSNSHIGAVALLESLKEEIVGWVKGELPEVDAGLIRGALESPRQEAHGDCSLPMMKLRVGGASAGSATAARLADSFRPFGHVVGVKAVDSFLNFSWDARRVVAAAIPAILESGAYYGHNKDGEGRLVLVEFGSPNMAKPFHAGHLRSAVLGSFLAAVYKANGYAVHTLNYLGDWGKQYGLLAVGMSRYGDDALLAADPIRHLFDVYVKINADADSDPSVHDEARAAFQRMEAGDESVLSLWRHCRDVSIEAYRTMYGRLNITYDEFTGESIYGVSALRAELEALQSAGLLKESEGAQIIDLSDGRLGSSLFDKRHCGCKRSLAHSSFSQVYLRYWRNSGSSYEAVEGYSY